MQRKFIALAATAVCGVASAQSSVTMFGTVDLGYQTVKTNAGTISGIAGSNSETSSKIGFRGIEDLGGGLSAGFELQIGVDPRSGAGTAGTSLNNQVGGVGSPSLTMARRSIVSLSGNFGEIRLGRDFVPTYWNYFTFDPVMYGDGVGAAMTEWGYTAATAFRASNMVHYFLPKNLGGFYGHVAYAFGERASNETFTGTTPAYAVGQDTSSNGNYAGVRLGYEQGPLNTAVTYALTKYAPGTNSTSALGTAATPFGNLTDLSWGGSYKFGPVQAMGLITRQTLSDAGTLGAEANSKSWLLGARWTVGPGVVMASYSRVSLSNPTLVTEPESNKSAVSYEYNLSKRTALYATYARVGNSDGAAETARSASPGQFGAVGGPANVNGSSTGFDIGLRHNF